jgi:phosphoribosylglycinamide formyltransferase-1
MMRLGILGSTRGTNMLALIEAIEQKQLAATIQLVLSNKPHALILERAKTAGLNAQFLDAKAYSREEYDTQISQLLQDNKIDLVVLIGYMRILSKEFVTQWHNKVINVHPSLLPAFSGKMDKEVHQAVLDAQIKETGCSIHYVTEVVDAGPVILQKKCPVLPFDTVDSLKERVQNLEGLALIEAIQML